MTADPDFFADAACRDYPTDWWFPDHHSEGFEALAICGRCPVRTDCLAWAIETKEDNGILGGLRQRPRRDLRRATERRARRKAKSA